MYQCTYRLYSTEYTGAYQRHWTVIGHVSVLPCVAGGACAACTASGTRCCTACRSSGGSASAARPARAPSARRPPLPPTTPPPTRTLTSTVYVDTDQIALQSRLSISSYLMVANNVCNLNKRVPAIGTVLVRLDYVLELLVSLVTSRFYSILAVRARCHRRRLHVQWRQHQQRLVHVAVTFVRLRVGRRAVSRSRSHCRCRSAGRGRLCERLARHLPRPTNPERQRPQAHSGIPAVLQVYPYQLCSSGRAAALRWLDWLGSRESNPCCSMRVLLLSLLFSVLSLKKPRSVFGTEPHIPDWADRVYWRYKVIVPAEYIA